MNGANNVLTFAPEPERPHTMERNQRAVDALVLTALQDELKAVLNIGPGWTQRRDTKGFPYHQCVLPSGLVVATAWIGEMGQTAAAARGQSLLHELDPSCLAMCGICAGDPEKVSLGDVIVANQLWPYDEGKQTESGFYHAMKLFQMERTWSVEAAFAGDWIDLEALSQGRPPTKATQTRWLLHTLYAHEFDGGPSPADHTARKERCPGYTEVIEEAIAKKLVTLQGRKLILTDTGKERVDRDAVLHPDGAPPDPDLRVRIGVMATGSAVIEDDGIFKRLRRINRETIALDMEGAAIAELAAREGKRFLVVKAVQDFANGQKDDTFRAFACRASAQFLLELLQKLVTAIAPPPPDPSKHIVLYTPKSLQSVWQGVLPNGTNPQLLFVETPEKQWYWDEQPDSPIWSSAFRGIQACADDLLQTPNRTLHVFAMLPYGLGAALGAMVLGPYRRRGSFFVYQSDYTTNAWNSWGPHTAHLEPGNRIFPIPVEITGTPEPTIRDVVLVIRLSRMMDETEIVRSVDVPSDATWVRATPDEVGPKAIATSGDVEGLVNWLGKLVDECSYKFPNASLHVFYAGPQAAFIRAGEHFILCGRPITIYDRNRAGGNEFRFVPVVRFEAGRVRLVVGEGTRGPDRPTDVPLNKHIDEETRNS